MANFRTDERGVVAIIFALMAVPFIALAGWAVDYVRIKHVQDFLQAQVDAAALNALVGATEDPDCLVPNDLWEAVFYEELAMQYSSSWASDVVVEGNCLNGNDFHVEAVADVPLAFIKLMPGIPDTQEVWVEATSRLNDVVKEYKIEVADLDYNAGDYNRVWAYCYWRDRPENDPDLPKRTQMVPIADNGGPNKNQRNVYERDPGVPRPYGDKQHIEDSILKAELAEINEEYEAGIDGRERGLWRQTAGGESNWREYVYVAPQCPDGSELSFRLENVRFSRGQAYYWEDEYNEDMGWDGHSRVDFAPGGHGHKGRFNYYTDTYYEDGVDGEQYDGLTLPDVNNPYVQPGAPAKVLETILCDTKEECETTADGGIIPHEQTDREPLRASESCQEGKYMYYGWEDRPPGLSGPDDTWEDVAWTDSDYDDIRVVIQCPVEKSIGDRNARLIH
ncbi:TadE/TadG family type IV pilus assembly protein [Pelagibacterium halotolerans]|uniref:TadE/TadG family type IV pilus assembly protein n=1 Tax=Pelagibacterium halotolerans TaxID=531813 RepID=UPI00384F8B88